MGCCVISPHEQWASYFVIEMPKKKRTLIFGAGRQHFCELGAVVVNQANDGERSLLLAADSEQPSKGSIDDPKLTLLAEEISVEKQVVETGRLRVSRQTHTREVAVDEDLLRESAEIETVPIGRRIFEIPSVRHEGETTIVPIVEEILHTERRLILKEEVRITRRKTTEQFHDRVTLRYQEAVVTRVQSASEAVDNVSAKESKIV
jgi:uncharacterized protein (TIGR02271 family)